MDTIKVLVKYPRKKWEEKTIPNTLEALQEIVDGHIEIVQPTTDTVVICNEEGLIYNLPYCCRIAGIPFVGPVILAGIDGEEFTDCPVPLETVGRRVAK